MSREYGRICFERMSEESRKEFVARGSVYVKYVRKSDEFWIKAFVNCIEEDLSVYKPTVFKVSRSVLEYIVSFNDVAWSTGYAHPERIKKKEDEIIREVKENFGSSGCFCSILDRLRHKWCCVLMFSHKLNESVLKRAKMRKRGVACAGAYVEVPLREAFVCGEKRGRPVGSLGRSGVSGVSEFDTERYEFNREVARKRGSFYYFMQNEKERCEALRVKFNIKQCRLEWEKAKEDKN